jgi:hypothetical protein
MLLYHCSADCRSQETAGRSVQERLLNLSLEAVKGFGEDAAAAGLTVPITESCAAEY